MSRLIKILIPLLMAVEAQARPPLMQAPPSTTTIRRLDNVRILCGGPACHRRHRGRAGVRGSAGHQFDGDCRDSQQAGHPALRGRDPVTSIKINGSWYRIQSIDIATQITLSSATPFPPNQSSVKARFGGEIQIHTATGVDLNNYSETNSDSSQYVAIQFAPTAGKPVRHSHQAQADSPKRRSSQGIGIALVGCCSTATDVVTEPSGVFSNLSTGIDASAATDVLILPQKFSGVTTEVVTSSTTAAGDWTAAACCSCGTIRQTSAPAEPIVHAPAISGRPWYRLYSAALPQTQPMLA